MAFRPAYLKRGLLLAAVAFVVVFSAEAQRAAHWRAQPILFSSPEGGDTSSNLPPLSAKSTEPLDFANTLQVPTAFNFNQSPAAVLPPGAPMILPGEGQRQQDLLDKRKNWILLTPAEILGVVATPETILGIPERDATGQRKNSTAMERYTERQHQMLSASTNAFPAGDSSPDWIFSGVRHDQPEAFHFFNGGPDNPAQLANPPFNPGLANQTLAGQNENNGWSKLFGSPLPSPVPNAAQQLNMDRFRQLLGSSPPSAGATTPSSSGTKFSPMKALLDSSSSQPSLGPMGASFAPLNSGIGRPADLPALPGVWGMSYTSSPSAAAWAPQQPPWMSPTPQPFAIPQRKF